jgi:hypothetical protein
VNDDGRALMPNALPLPLALLAGKESPGANVPSEFAKLGLGQTPPGARSRRAHNRGDGNQRDDRRRRIGNGPVTALRPPSRLDHVIARRHKRRAHDRLGRGPRLKGDCCMQRTPEPTPLHQHGFAVFQGRLRTDIQSLTRDAWIVDMSTPSACFAPFVFRRGQPV